MSPTLTTKLMKTIRYGMNSRIYVWEEGESVIENMQKRQQRPVTYYKQIAVPAALVAMGAMPFCTVRWSQKCGCSCGCSPGFIVSGSYGKEVHVTITHPSALAAEQAARRAAAHAEQARMAFEQV